MSTQRYTERPELDTDGRQECDRCGWTFHRDSSPNLFLCWACDLDDAAERGEQR